MGILRRLLHHIEMMAFRSTEYGWARAPGLCSPEHDAACARRRTGRGYRLGKLRRMNHDLMATMGRRVATRAAGRTQAECSRAFPDHLTMLAPAQGPLSCSPLFLFQAVDGWTALCCNLVRFEFEDPTRGVLYDSTLLHESDETEPMPIGVWRVTFLQCLSRSAPPWFASLSTRLVARPPS